jgi:hypothetical protein
MLFIIRYVIMVPKIICWPWVLFDLVVWKRFSEVCRPVNVVVRVARLRGDVVPEELQMKQKDQRRLLTQTRTLAPTHLLPLLHDPS